MPEPPILEVEGLATLLGGERRFLRAPRPPVRAVDGVSLAVRRGEILGVVGESGCGKSTLGRTVLGIQRESAGSIRLDGQEIRTGDVSTSYTSRGRWSRCETRMSKWNSG